MAEAEFRPTGLHETVTRYAQHLVTVSAEFQDLVAELMGELLREHMDDEFGGTHYVLWADLGDIVDAYGDKAAFEAMVLAAASEWLRVEGPADEREYLSRWQSRLRDYSSTREVRWADPAVRAASMIAVLEQAARLYLDGAASSRWVVDKVDELNVMADGALIADQPLMRRLTGRADSATADEVASVCRQQLGLASGTG